MKTSELTGSALDWAVAKCEGLRTYVEVVEGFKPSTDWAQGGSIIEREHISLWSSGHTWEAQIENDSDEWLIEWNDSPLVAAMRCYVASKLGDDVEIPAELLGE
jgi:Protein of unknown function (DUF2591)